MTKLVLSMMLSGFVALVIACCGGAPTPSPPPLRSGTSIPTAIDPESVPVEIRELPSYRKAGQNWRNIVVPPGIERESLIALATELHRQDSESSFRFFDDDEHFNAFQVWDEHYPDPNYPSPEEWTERHYLAMLNPMGTREGLQWQLIVVEGMYLLPKNWQSLTLATFETVNLDGEVVHPAPDPAVEAARRRVEDKHRRQEIEQRQVEQEAKDRNSRQELAMLLSASYDLASIAGIDDLNSRLIAFIRSRPGTKAAEKARSESAALAALRLAYVWATRGKDPEARLRQVIEGFPGTVAANEAERQLGESE